MTAELNGNNRTRDIMTFTWRLGHGRALELAEQSIIMGILNVTPDSFSDGGKYEAVDVAIQQAEEMFADGASIIDIGGESTRPGAETVTQEEECNRVLPVIEALSKYEDMLLSVDTYRAETAKQAAQAGAHIINDVWGFQKDPEIAKIAAQMKSGVCSMHTGREREKKTDVIADQLEFLKTSLTVLEEAGVKDEAIVLDPGFGFAKSPEENIELLSRVDELLALGYPLLIGTSRKRFIGHFTGKDESERDIGTSATSVVARMKGASIFRVHDVKSNKDALAIADAVIAKGK